MSVRRSVRRSVGPSVPLLIFRHLRAVFALLLLPNHMKLMLSCIQDLLLPLPPTLPPLPNRTRRCRFVYPALFILQQWYSTVYISSPQIQLFPTVTKGRIGRPHQSLHKVRMRHLSAEYPRSGYMVGETQVTNRCYFYPPPYSPQRSAPLRFSLRFPLRSAFRSAQLIYSNLSFIQVWATG